MQKICSRKIATVHDGLFYLSISEKAWRRSEDIMLTGTWCDWPENHKERLLSEHFLVSF